MLKIVAITLLMSACLVTGNILKYQIVEDIKSGRIGKTAEDLRAGGLPNLPTLASSLGLKQLLQMLEYTDLDVEIAQPGAITFFASTDKGIDNLPHYLRTRLYINDTLTRQFLLYSTTPSYIPSEGIRDELRVPSSFNGLPIRFNVYNDKTVTVQCAPLVMSKLDNQASNGILHETSTLPIPPIFGGMANTIRGVNYYVGFELLLIAIEKAYINDFLQSDVSFTFFAPCDDAFAKLSGDVLDRLFTDPKGLRDFIRGHLVYGAYCAAGLETGDVTSLKSLNGSPLSITRPSKGSIKVNDAMVLGNGKYDISATNGVIHTIDSVLGLPSYYTQEKH